MFTLAIACATFTATPAGAVGFVYTSGPTFTGADSFRTDFCVGSGGSASTLDFTCVLDALPNTPTQTLTNYGDSFVYYIGALTTNDPGVSGGEAAGPWTLTLTFGTDITSGFSLLVPATYTPGGAWGTLTMSTVRQALGVTTTPEEDYLFATLLFSNTQYANDPTSQHITSPPALDTSASWTANSQTRYLYLQLTYDTPEPATFLLIGSALAGLGLLRRRLPKA